MGSEMCIRDRSSGIDDLIVNARLAARNDHPQRRTVPVFDQSLRNALALENETANAILNGIEQRQFLPFYQIKVNTVTGQPTGMEALCRWQHPEHGLVSPARFIPVAEKRGMIVDLTWQMFDSAASDFIQWWHSGLNPGHIAVNVAEAVLLSLIHI